MENLFEKLFIFEMANNHQGSLDHGLRIIREMGKVARKAGIRAGVKFQYRDMDTFIHKDFVDRKDVKHIPRFLSTRLDWNDYATMVQAVKEEDMLGICTPFDENSVSLILDHGMDIIKIASCIANDWPLIEKISQSHKPVICSTGGLNLTRIDNVVSFLTHREVNFALMHCVGLYPTPAKNVHANFIDKLIKRFPSIPIGYSGHEDPDNTDIIKVVVAKGAKMFERHIGVETETIELNAYSMNPQQAENWVNAAMKAFSICGDSNKKRITQDEIDSLNTLIRGVYARKEITKGDRLTRDKVYFAMPYQEGQTNVTEYIDSLVASRDYAADERITERRPFNRNFSLREIIHDIKGMLYEAGIPIGKNFNIELSHHYGIERIRQYGAVLINIVNRNYCKKLIIVLPGQNHPTHAHKIKEETFQLLWGDMEVVLDNTKRILLKPGDSLLVEPNVKHSFTTANGAIFEEISTTHLKGDSYYDDEMINKKDLLERKTIVENW